MKKPWEWEEKDLLELISARTQESINLDYKACDALGTSDGKKNEISKDVSAIANSAGGTIVYGLLEDGHVPTQIDCGFDPQRISKEWLEQVINSRIHRRIDGIKIKQVNLAEKAPGKVSYIVCIPQSLRAPHQAADKRFYKRFNFESVPMEEYEIRDVAHRRDAPDLRVEIKLISDNFISDSALVTIPTEGAYSEPFELRLRVINDAPTPAEHAAFLIFIDTGIEIIWTGGFYDGGEVSAFPSNFRVLQDIWSPSTKKLPIFEGLPLSLINNIKIAVPKDACNKTFVIRWEVHSPGMSVKRGVRLLLFDGTFVHLQDTEQLQP